MKQDSLHRFAKRISLTLPLFGSTVRAGFPSPADDHLDRTLDLNEHLIEHPAATFFCRIKGDSMQGIGIMDDTILVVDRAIKPKHGDIVLAAIDGELTCKVLDTHHSCLRAANEKYSPIHITENMDCVIEGVVTSWITESHVRPS